MYLSNRINFCICKDALLAKCVFSFGHSHLCWKSHRQDELFFINHLEFENDEEDDEIKRMLEVIVLG